MSKYGEYLRCLPEKVPGFLGFTAEEQELLSKSTTRNVGKLMQRIAEDIDIVYRECIESSREESLAACFPSYTKETTRDSLSK